MHLVSECLTAKKMPNLKGGGCQWCSGRQWLDTKEKEMSKVAAVVLAGGQGSRMGGQDKGLLMLQGKPLVQRVVDRFTQSGVAAVVVSANRNLAQYRALFPVVVSDDVSGYPGPLAGIAAAIKAVPCDYLVVAPCDSPFFPLNYVEALRKAAESSPQLICAAARSQDKRQPVFCLIRGDMAADIEAFLAAGNSKVRQWLEEHQVQWVDFPELAAFDNINTPQDLEAAQKRV